MEVKFVSKLQRLGLLYKQQTEHDDKQEICLYHFFCLEMVKCRIFDNLCFQHRHLLVKQSIGTIQSYLFPKLHRLIVSVSTEH